MAKAPNGWFTDPEDSTLTRLWDGEAWTDATYPKSVFTDACIKSGIPVPDYDHDPANVPEGSNIRNASHEGNQAKPKEAEPETVSEPGFWFRNEELPEHLRMMRWLENGTVSEFFSTDAVLEAVTPDFVINGGTHDLVERWAQSRMTAQEIELVLMLMSRTSAEKVRALSGDSAPEFNDGPRWIVNAVNPSIADWWSGNNFTGERELVTVLRQRAFDEESTTIETVSHIAPPNEMHPGLWQTDPENEYDMIRWGGLRWDLRVSMEKVLQQMFAAVGEEVPAAWAGRHVITPRHYELMKQLAERAEGIEGWYKDPTRFDDLFMRYWAAGAWTEHTSVQQAGWFDDPWDAGYTRYWDGQQWSSKTKNKEAERIRAEKAQARKAFVGSIALDFVGNVAAQYTPEMKRRNAIDAANANSRALRDEASFQQEKFYRDRQKPWWK